MAGKRNYNKISTEATEATVEEIVVEDVVETVTEEIAPAPKKTGVVCNCIKLNVRKKPDVEAKALRVIDAGTEVEIINDTDKNFYEVKVDGAKGFCMKKYIK